jgi:hypothetical protein
LAGIGQQAFAQAQLDNLKIITGFAAGGTSDTTAAAWRRRSPRPMRTAVVENRTGAGGQIAIQTIKGRPADGATILQTPTSMFTIYPHIYKRCRTTRWPTSRRSAWPACSTSASRSARGAGQRAQRARVRRLGQGQPGQATFGSPAAGSTPHFIPALLGIKRRRSSSSTRLPRHAAGHAGPAGRPDPGGQRPHRRPHAAPGQRQGAHPGHLGRQAQPLRPRRAHLHRAGLRRPAAQRVVRLLPAAQGLARTGRARQRGHAHALADKDVVDGLATFGLEAMSSRPRSVCRTWSSSP